VSQKTEIKVEGRTLQLSNLEKVMYPATGFTKSQVIDYYIRISSVLLPHLKNRPLTMKRYPDGIEGNLFYEKNAPVHTPEWVQTSNVHSSKKIIRFVMVNDLPTLVWSANLANLELHTFLAQAPKIEQPTSVVFDLDPGPPADVVDCAQIAFWIKEIAEALKLKCFVKVSGSKGLQLYVPLNTPTSYEETKTFSKTIAETVGRLHPDRALSNMSKELRVGKVFIDWSQNSVSKTTVNVYSLRAKDRPYVSIPVTWEELKQALQKADPASLYMEAEQVIKRVEKIGDLFEPLLTLKQKISATYPKLLSTIDLSKPIKTARETPVAALKGPSKAKKSDTSIETYNLKRDFKKTQEPPGARATSSKSGGELMYVIQKHQASHLHYDFRLEMEGVLRSWAVPKGIPTTRLDKKLAMHVEDHPMSYARFEGTIPKGSYGGGTVMVWDIGTYTDETGHPVRAYYTGKMHLIMNGSKLKGEWVLVRSGKKDEPKQRWLLMKAGTDMPAFSAKKDDQSALTGRTMKQIATDNDAQWVSNRKSSDEPAQGHEEMNQALQELRKLPRSVPKFLKLLHPKMEKKLPEKDGWMYEIKFDGQRVIAIKKNDKVELLSETKKNLNKKYPEIVQALAALPAQSFALDGEIIHLDGENQEYFLCFDLLNYQDRDTTDLPLNERRQILESLLNEPPDGILLSTGIEGNPKKIVQEAKKRGFKKIIARKKDSRYKAGKQNSWIEFAI
jgi:bifunctional non-homologous end joining protein LigD